LFHHIFDHIFYHDNPPISNSYTHFQPFKDTKFLGDDGMSLTDVASGAVGAVGGLLGGAAPWTWRWNAWF